MYVAAGRLTRLSTANPCEVSDFTRRMVLCWRSQSLPALTFWRPNRKRRRALLQVQAELQASRVGHAAGVPRRVEDDVHVDFFDLRKRAQFAFDVGFQHIAHPAT